MKNLHNMTKHSVQSVLVKHFSSSCSRQIRLSYFDYFRLIKEACTSGCMYSFADKGIVNRLAIITSAFKSERYFRRYSFFIEKVIVALMHAGVKVELIIVSNDPTKSEHRSFAKLIKLVKAIGCNGAVLEVPRESLYRSWNRGIQNSISDAICFWNMDDIRFAPALLISLNLIRQGCEKFVYFPYLRSVRWSRFPILRKHFIYSPPSFLLESLPNDFYLGPFFVVSRSLLNEVGLFNPLFRVSGDLEWCCRAVKATNFTYVNTIAGVFFDDGVGLSTEQSKTNISENIEIFRRYGDVSKR